MTPPIIPLLPYDVIRPLIRSGDLLLCQGEGIFARLIRHATASPWSHVGCLLVVNMIERILVLESVESIGVRAVALSRYVVNYNNTGKGYPGRVFIGRHRAFSSELLPAFHAFFQRAIDLLDSRYGTTDILRIAARVLAIDVGAHPQPMGRNEAYICSEYQEEIFRAFGITVPRSIGGYIAPKDWAEAPEVDLLWEVELGTVPSRTALLPSGAS